MGMVKLKIITGENNPILRTVSVPVVKFDKALRGFVKQMKASMVAAKGIGIAAPQVGKNVRVFLAVLNHGTDQRVTVPIVNPEIISHGNETGVAEEGCLSLPGKYGQVERFTAVNVVFFDLDGGRQSLDLTGLNARIIQHETDHLNGVLFIDRIKEMEQRKGLVL